MNLLRARLDLIFAALLFAGTGSLYVRTLAPGLLNGDSAEFQTITYTLGMGHPTGYPIYVLIGKIFTFLPVGEIAYRVNFFSSISAAGTVVVTYFIIRQIGANHASAFFGSLMLAFIPEFWKFASVAEVYTLSAACLAFIILCVLKWNGSSQPMWIILAGLFGGLSLGIHLSIALTAPAILIYLAYVTARQKRAATLKYALLGTAAGLCLFLFAFLYIDHRNSPAGYYNSVIRPSLSVWEMTAADFDSPLERLAYLYFPPQFRGNFFAASSDDVILRLKDIGSGHWALLAFGILGAFSSFAPNRKDFTGKSAAPLLLLILIISATFASTYDVYDYYAFYSPSFLALAIFAGLGFHWMSEIITAAAKSAHPARASGILCCAALALLFYGSVSSAWHDRMPPNLSQWDKYGFQSPAVYKFKAEKITAVLEDDAIVFTNWSKLYSLYYAAIILHGKTGMDFHQAHPQEDDYEIADSLIDYIEANIGKRPIYFTMYPASLADRYSISPASADLYRIERK